MWFTHPNVHIYTLGWFSDRYTQADLLKQEHALAVYGCLHTCALICHRPFFTKCSVCKLNKVCSSVVYFELQALFCLPPPPLLLVVLFFFKVHICQWFVKQPAKFTTLRSNVFLFLVVLHFNLACWKEQKRKICKAVKITPPFTWCWKRPFHSFTEMAGGKYLSMQVKKRVPTTACTHLKQ